MTSNRTITELYQALRPLLLRDVAVAVGGSGTAAGGMETHALSSNWHTGTLAETQAPWAATKNEWATALATHAALVDVHHAAVTAGDGIGVSGQQVSLLATVAGAGLTHASGVLAVGAGTLLTVGADAVGITAGSSYQFIGTGSGTAAAWQNLSGLAGAGLTHAAGVLAVGVSGLGLSVAADAVALASSSNPGAAASILASTAAGGLTLVSLGVTEAATVGGDFTVGANVLFVNQAGTRVGINRAPDQQFDLDVAGAIRGQYLVGRHAIQLASAVGVWHFDGAAPYALDYSGSNASHMGVAGTEAGGLIFRPGRYGKAAQVAPATTNLITNPSFETNTTGWGTDYPAATTLTRVADGWVGAYFLRVAATGTGNFYSPAVTVANNTAYAASFWYRTTATVQVRVVEYGTNTHFGLATLPAATEWTRYTIPLTTPASGSSTIRIGFSALEAGESIDIDAVQVEQSDAATPYCDGSLGGGHSWSGTAHASTSSRTGATLIYPVGMGFDAAEGSILMWVRLDGLRSAGMGLFGTGSNAQFDAYIASTGAISFRLNNVSLDYSAGIAAGDWHLLGFTWSQSGNVRTVYLDGVAVATRQYDSGATIGSNLYVGSVTAGAGYSVNGLIDEFVLTDYAMDAKLVRAIYESDAPVFVESSVFHWRSPSRVPIWVDEFGLWARGVTGNEILGLYGGDPRNPTGGVTKSWGGVTLSENDVLIGRAAGGYVFWDDSAQTMNLKGAMVVDGNSYFNGVVTIATGGELRQGTGTLGSNYTGLRIWRDGDMGRIGGYASNTLQWYAGTDGKFYAGGGSVWLDANGFNLVAGNGSIDSMNSIEWLSGSQSQLRLSSMYVASDGKVKSFVESTGTSDNQISELAISASAYYPGSGSVKWSRIVLTGPTSAEPSIKFTLTGSSYGIDSLESNSTYSRIRTIYGYVDIGPQSSNYAHISTDRASFKFNVPTITATLLVDSDYGGAASTIGFSNVSNTAANSTGVGTVLMKGATSRNSAGFIKIYIGTTAYYVPVFSAITG